jgi:hypothetical protein
MAWIYVPAKKREAERWEKHLTDRDVAELKLSRDGDSDWLVVYMDRIIGGESWPDLEIAQDEAVNCLRQFLTGELAALAGN